MHANQCQKKRVEGVPHIGLELGLPMEPGRYYSWVDGKRQEEYALDRQRRRGTIMRRKQHFCTTWTMNPLTVVFLIRNIIGVTHYFRE